jgi:hypothetical protein
MCNETVTTAGDEDICGNSNYSSNVTDVVVSRKAQFENIQSSTPVCDGDDWCNVEHLENVEVSKERDDTRVLMVTNKVIDPIGENIARNTANPVDSEGEMPVKCQDTLAELESSSETVINTDKNFEHAEGCDAQDHKLVKQSTPNDTELLSCIESSHSPSAVEHENGSSSVVSSKSDEVSHSHHCNETREEKESDVCIFQELNGVTGIEDNLAVLNDESGDLELQSDENKPTKMIGDVESEKSANVVMHSSHKDQIELRDKSVDAEMQNCQNKHDANPCNLEMQDYFTEGSVGIHDDTFDSGRKLVSVEVQGNHTELHEVPFDADGHVGPNDQIDHTGNDQNSYNKLVVKPTDLQDEDNEAEWSGKSCNGKRECSEIDVSTNFVRIRVRDSSELQPIPTDSKKNDDAAVDADTVLKMKANNEQRDTVCSGNETSLIEPEHAMDDREGKKKKS